MSYYQYKKQLNDLLIVLFLLSILMKEIENSYKLKLLDEKELKEHFSLFYLILPLLYLSPTHLRTLFGYFIASFPLLKKRRHELITNNFILRLVDKLFLSSSNLK